VRILLDECVNPRVRSAFPDHNVLTVAEAQWRKFSDTKLIAQTQGRFDVLATIDRGFEFEHNLRNLTFGIVIVHVHRNRIEYYRPLFPALVDAVERIRPGEVIHVPASVR
jgi:hypothetical protein